MRNVISPASTQARGAGQKQASPQEAKSFEEKMRAAEKQDQTAEEAKAEQADTEEPMSFLQDDGAQQEQEGDSLGGGLAQGVPERLATPQAAEVKPTTAMADPAQTAQLERMAAAIAEAVQSGAKNVVSIEFGAGSLLAQSAVISGDATTGLTIRLVNPNGGIAANQWTQLRNQLVDRLEKRKLAARIIVERKDGQQS